jgi:hypothetical protein
MAKVLVNDTLIQSVGAFVKNSQGEPIGKIKEIIRGIDGGSIEYLILKSDAFFGRGYRFFAIPASSKLLKITDGGGIKFQAHTDNLQFARGVEADKCPKPNFQSVPSIFELYLYREPQ